jgi:hypothetical protein
MNSNELYQAVLAVGGAVRAVTNESRDAIAILTTSLCFECANSKVPECSWDAMEALLIASVRASFAESKRVLTKHAPNG